MKTVLVVVHSFDEKEVGDIVDASDAILAIQASEHSYKAVSVVVPLTDQDDTKEN